MESVHGSLRASATFLPRPLALLAALLAALLPILVVSVLVVGCRGVETSAEGAGTGSGGGQVGRSAGGEWVVSRGPLDARLLLTGRFVAEEGYEVTVPRTSTWQLQIRWLIEDGTEVAPGDRLLELDNSSFASELEDKRLSAAETAIQLTRRRAELAATEADALFRVEEAEAELARNRLRSSVPEGLLARREMEDRRLALARAEAELAKAEADLESQRVAAKTDLARLTIDLREQEGEITAAEEAIAALRVVAPRSGVAVLAEHPWEPRTLQEGDTVWVGMTVLRLPDLEAMIVEADLSDVDQGRLAAGTPVTLTLDAFPDAPFVGKVADVTPIAQEERGESLRRFFRVVITPEKVDPERMRPGMSVKVEARQGGEGEHLLVPRIALDLASSPPRAHLAGGGWVEVELGPCGARDCAVVAGLEEGQRLIAAEEGP